MGTQRQIDTVLDFQILRICQVLQMEETLYLFNTLLSQVDCLLLLIGNIISCFVAVFLHNNVHLGQLFFCSSFQLAHQIVAGLIDLGGFTAGSGNDQRRSGLIDQYRVNLIHDSIVQFSLNQLLFVDHHVITKVIKSQFVVGCISNIAVICFSTLIITHAV